MQGLHEVAVDGRHLSSTVHCDLHVVLGAEAIAKHLIVKHIGMPALTVAPHAMRSYATPALCEQQFQEVLLRTERTRGRPDVRSSKVQTVGSPAFRLFLRFNTTSTSKITSAFPEHGLEFAQSVCLATGFLAIARNKPRAGVLLAHTLQELAVSAPAAQRLRILAELALAPRARTADFAAEPSAEPPADALKAGKLSLLLEDGAVYTTPFVTLDAETTRLLAGSGVCARSETPMYMVFDRQRNAVLVANVCILDCEVLGGSLRMQPLSAAHQAVADMHYVNVSTAYHLELSERRQLLLNKACASVSRPSAYQASIFNMLRFEHSPMLALLAQQDL